MNELSSAKPARWLKFHNIIMVCLVFVSFSCTPQSIDDLSFGTDSTFEAMTWNVEWFPKNGQATVDSVIRIIEALDIDLIALQEISDTILFKQMLDNLDGYEGYFESGWFAGLAYIYKTDVVHVNDIYEIYTTAPYWSPFPRSPMVIDFDVMDENYVLINNHFKCCGDGTMDIDDTGDEETRRYIATNLLKEYVDTYLQEKSVFIVGDLNDIITDDPSNNVFQNILNASEHYLFADYEIGSGNSAAWSYPTWPSHLDHIIITNELFDEYYADNTQVTTIKIENYLPGGWTEYDRNISDHRPVAMKFTPSISSDIHKNNPVSQTFYNYPNPCNSVTTFCFDPHSSNVEIEVFNTSGKRVFKRRVHRDQTSITWNVKGLPDGIYVARLIGDHIEISTAKVILTK